MVHCVHTDLLLQVLLVIRERPVRRASVVQLEDVGREATEVNREQLVPLVAMELLEPQVGSVILDLLDGLVSSDPLDGLDCVEFKDGPAFLVYLFRHSLPLNNNAVG